MRRRILPAALLVLPCSPQLPPARGLDPQRGTGSRGTRLPAGLPQLQSFVERFIAAWANEGTTIIPGG